MKLKDLLLYGAIGGVAYLALAGESTPKDVLAKVNKLKAQHLLDYPNTSNARWSWDRKANTVTVTSTYTDRSGDISTTVNLKDI